jgi:hypothetical protein
LLWSTKNLYTISFAFVIESLGTLKLLNKPRGYAHNEVWSWLNLVLLICVKIYHVNFIFVVIIPFFFFFCQKSFFQCVLSKFFYIMSTICTFFCNRIIRSLTSCIVQEKNVERCDKGQYHLLITSCMLWRGYLFSFLQVLQLSLRCYHILSLHPPGISFFLSLAIELTVCHRRISEYCWPAAEQTCHLVKIFLYPQWRTCLVMLAVLHGM